MAETRDGAGGPARSLDFIREQVRTDNAAGIYRGRVQTRFPPEPNGFLHLGHAKAVCLNFEVAAEHGGACRLRFDDTNPAGEDAAYAEAIADDIAWLGYEPDGQAVHASDYFEQLYAWAEHLVRERLAYVDDQDAETISATRGDFSTPGVESPCRNRSVEENLSLLRDMRAGRFGDGSRVLRAKIDMAHPNMLMRDPVMYRIRHTAHFRTGTAWCIYPTYDWAHGQSDAIEGVTHSLCSLEFDAHRQLYDWYLEHLPLPGDRPRQYEFARLNLTHTVTSKRGLSALIEQGLVDGWDDPRLPTLRGLRRRGYPPEAIREFCAHIGVARVNGVHEVELLESFVRTHHNRAALRRMAVLRPLEVVIDNWPEGHVEHRRAVNNPEDPAAGTREVPFSGRLWIERDDFMLDPPRKFYRLGPGREVRLRAGYFLRCNDVETDSGGQVVGAALHLRSRNRGRPGPRRPQGAGHHPLGVGRPRRGRAGCPVQPAVHRPRSRRRRPRPSGVLQPRLTRADHRRQARTGTARRPAGRGGAVRAPRVLRPRPRHPHAVPPHRRPPRRVGQHPETPRVAWLGAGSHETEGLRHV